MLPKLRIILAAVFATCAAVLALSAGILVARDPGNGFNGTPDVSRALARETTAAEPDSQLQLFAYSRRADELLRLRDLPVPPVRAVVDYAEQAQARATETATAAVSPAAPRAADSATAPGTAGAPTPTGVATAPVATPSADAAPARAADSAAVTPPPTEALPPTAVATAPVSSRSSDTPAATPVAPADTKVAAVATGGSETAEMYGPEKPKAKRHRAKAAHAPKPKKKLQATLATPRVAPTTTTPATSYMFNQPFNQPNNLTNNTFGVWRNSNTANTSKTSNTNASTPR